jgi:hypothetical protein
MFSPDHLVCQSNIGEGTGLLRLHSTYRHDLKIYSSDEGRVQVHLVTCMLFPQSIAPYGYVFLGTLVAWLSHYTSS